MLSGKLLAFIEYKESKACKNGVNPGSVSDIIRTKSANNSI